MVGMKYSTSGAGKAFYGKLLLWTCDLDMNATSDKTDRLCLSYRTNSVCASLRFYHWPSPPTRTVIMTQDNSNLCWWNNDIVLVFTCNTWSSRRYPHPFVFSLRTQITSWWCSEDSPPSPATLMPACKYNESSWGCFFIQKAREVQDKSAQQLQNTSPDELDW